MTTPNMTSTDLPADCSGCGILRIPTPQRPSELSPRRQQPPGNPQERSCKKNAQQRVPGPAENSTNPGTPNTDLVPTVAQAAARGVHPSDRKSDHCHANNHRGHRNDAHGQRRVHACALDVVAVAAALLREATAAVPAEFRRAILARHMAAARVLLDRRLAPRAPLRVRQPPQRIPGAALPTSLTGHFPCAAFSPHSPQISSPHLGHPNTPPAASASPRSIIAKHSSFGHHTRPFPFPALFSRKYTSFRKSFFGTYGLTSSNVAASRFGPTSLTCAPL
eukprot:CAMPEP_0174908298 /NCGR_PEP_ID=MMETSP0167-20121228/64219_1 /TAXON_ID=38298 /ORGANISM="Rhodella maculata, Strain CCMP736" /LENGTH=277 /DNA_ID=CAMNT_0016152021 /DNA_START=261 /DNA_END=1096 /DNA_ORIENTATION=+